MIQLLLTKPEGASQEGGVPGGASSAPANTLAPLPPLPLRHARGSTHPTLLARALRPEGTLARVCAALADTPGADDPDALLEAGVSLLLRALFLRCAAGRGLLPGAEESLAPGRLAWDGLRELCCAVARGEAAPGAASPGGLFDDDAHPLLRAARPDERLLAGALRELSEAPDGAPVDFGALPVRLLGTLQEEASGRRLVRRGGRLLLAGGNGARGARGVYYTPEPLVEELVRATVEPTAQEFLAARPTAVAETTLPRILDPAMGSGHFLVCAARCLGDVLTAAHMRAGDSPLVDEGSGQQAAGGFSLLPAALQPAQDARSAAPGRAEAVLPASRRALRRLVAERCLFGVDLHPAAADLARLCLWLECSEPGAPLRLPETRLRAGESLLGVDWAREHPSGFDVVLGNPPWGAELGLERARLRRAYASARGEIESAALFIELALRLCRPGGRVGLVTPNTWLTLVRQAGLRHSVLEAGRLELLVEQAPGAFAGVRSVVPLAFVLRRGPGAPPGPTLVRGPHGEHLAEQEVWRRAEGAVIDLRLGRAARRVLERIDARSEPLGAVARVAYGIKTGDNAANLACEPLSTEHRPALADGAEVRRHAIAWGGRFLRYGPHLAGYRRAPVDVPKIVVQYIRNLGLPQRLVAAVDERGAYYPLNNFSYITATGPYDLFYLAALLCSSPLNAVFAGRYRDYNIKPAYLRRLPIRRVAFTTPPALRAALLAEALALPEDDLLAFVERRLAAIPEQADVVHDLLAALARRLAALHRQPPGTPPAGADAASRTDALIDAIVLRLYGLDAADMAALGDTASSAAAHTDAPIGPTPGAMP